MVGDLRRLGANGGVNTVRVLISDGSLDEEAVCWLRHIPWHMVISFGPNESLQTDLRQLIAVEPLDPAFISARRNVPSTAAVAEIVRGAKCLWLNAGSLARPRAAANLTSAIRILTEELATAPLVIALLTNSRLGTDSELARDSIKAVIEQSVGSPGCAVVAVAPQQDDIAVLSAAPARQFHLHWGSRPGTVLSRLADIIGCPSLAPFDDTMTSQLQAAMKDHLRLIDTRCAPPTLDGLRRMQREFLAGGRLEVSLVCAEQVLCRPGVPASIVTRDFGPTLVQTIRDAVAEARASRSPKHVELLHAAVTGGSSLVRLACTTLVREGLIIGVEVVAQQLDATNTRHAAMVGAVLDWVQQLGKVAVCISDGVGDTRQFFSSIVADKAVVTLSVRRNSSSHARPSPTVINLRLPETLSAAETQRFQEVYEQFEEKADRHGAEGRDSVFLWGIGIFADKFSPMQEYIQHHADRLNADERTVLRLVSVVGWFADESPDVSKEMVAILLKEVASWSVLSHNHKSLLALLRCFGLTVTAPVLNKKVCSMLCHAAALPDFPQPVSSGVGLGFEKEVVVQTVRLWLNTANAQGFDLQHVKSVNDAFFLVSHSEFGDFNPLLDFVGADEGMRLFQALADVSCSSQAHYLGHKALYLSTQGEFDIALADIERSIAIAHQAAQGKETTPTLSTVHTIKGTVLRRQIKSMLQKNDGHLLDLLSNEDFRKLYTCALESLEAGWIRKIAPTSEVNSHAVAESFELLYLLLERHNLGLKDQGFDGPVWPTIEGNEQLWTLYPLAVQWLDRLEDSLELCLQAKRPTAVDLLASFRSRLSEIVGLVIDQETIVAALEATSQDRSSLAMLGRAGELRNGRPWRALAEQQGRPVVPIIFASLYHFLASKLPTSSWLHRHTLITAAVYGGASEKILARDVVNADWMASPPTRPYMPEASAVYMKWKAALHLVLQDGAALAVCMASPLALRVPFEDNDWFIKANDSSLAAITTLRPTQRDQTYLWTGRLQTDWQGECRVSLPVGQRSFDLPVEHLPRALAADPQGKLIMFRLVLKIQENYVRMVATFYQTVSSRASSLYC